MSLRGFSQTAIDVAIARAAHQLFDDDPKLLADPLALTFLDDATRGALSAHDPAILALAHPAARVHFCLRSRIAEDCLERAVELDVNQYAILGAGLDSFAYRQPAWARAVRIVEIDHPKTQAFKREWLRSRSLEPAPNVEYLAVDFAAESLVERLRQAPLNETRPIFVSWLGVTQYLTRAATTRTLQTLAGWPGGCGLVITYVPADWSAFPPEARAQLEWYRERAASVGEPWLSLYSEAEMSAALRAAGFAALTFFDASELQSRYFSRRSDGLVAREGPSPIIGAHTRPEGRAWFELLVPGRKGRA
jgi:methyltransferase (TIGR00027 family)